MFVVKTVSSKLETETETTNVAHGQREEEKYQNRPEIQVYSHGDLPLQRKEKWKNLIQIPMACWQTII